jgi:pimeloyl-ACP methyl ester carboxylesterase
MDVGSLAYRVYGSDAAVAVAGTARPVVLVHGIGMSHRYLAMLHRELARDRTVYSIDLPGFGGLPKPGHNASITEMARGLGEVVASLGAGPFVLVGQSMGSQWVIELGRQRPDLVSQVVVIGPVTDVRHRTAGAQLRALALDSVLERPTTNAILVADYVRCGIRWYLAQVRHMLTYRTEDAVADLEMPLVVLRGGHDPIAGVRWCRQLRDRARQGSFVTVPGGPHNVQRTAPRAVASAIRAFADIPPTGRWRAS